MSASPICARGARRRRRLEAAAPGALSTADLTATIRDYTGRLGAPPCLVVPGEYALWRNGPVNLSVRQTGTTPPGTLLHLGFEDPAAPALTTSTDINGLLWEHFSAGQQEAEILRLWPDCGYRAGDS